MNGFQYILIQKPTDVMHDSRSLGSNVGANLAPRRAVSESDDADCCFRWQCVYFTCPKRLVD